MNKYAQIYISTLNKVAAIWETDAEGNRVDVSAQYKADPKLSGTITDHTGTYKSKDFDPSEGNQVSIGNAKDINTGLTRDQTIADNQAKNPVGSEGRINESIPGAVPPPTASASAGAPSATISSPPQAVSGMPPSPATATTTPKPTVMGNNATTMPTMPKQTTTPQAGVANAPKPYGQAPSVIGAPKANTKSRQEQEFAKMQAHLDSITDPIKKQKAFDGFSARSGDSEGQVIIDQFKGQVRQTQHRNNYMNGGHYGVGQQYQKRTGVAAPSADMHGRSVSTNLPPGTSRYIGGPVPIGR